MKLEWNGFPKINSSGSNGVCDDMLLIRVDLVDNSLGLSRILHNLDNIPF